MKIPNNFFLIEFRLIESISKFFRRKGGDIMAKNKDYKPTQADRDNRSNQLNPNNPEYKGNDKESDGDRSSNNKK